MKQLENLAKIAVCSLLAKKDAKEALKPGAYVFRGELTFFVDAEITKGEPEVYRATAHLPLKSIMAICLARLGFHRDRIIELILEAAHEAMTGDYKDQVGEYLEVTDAALKAVEETLEKLPPAWREGKTSVKGTLDLVELEPAGQ